MLQTRSESFFGVVVVDLFAGYEINNQKAKSDGNQRSAEHHRYGYRVGIEAFAICEVAESDYYQRQARQGAYAAAQQSVVEQFAC